MATKSRKAHSSAYGKAEKRKPTTELELARREWCKRNFLLAGIKKNITMIATEINKPAGNYLVDVEDLIVQNNHWGRDKGLNIA